MEIKYFPHTHILGAHYVLKLGTEISISDFNETFHRLEKKDSTFDRFKEHIKSNIILYNNTILIRDTRAKMKYAKINRDMINKNQLIIEKCNLEITQYINSYSLNTCCSTIEVIPYTDELKVLFDYIDFMK